MLTCWKQTCGCRQYLAKSTKQPTDLSAQLIMIIFIQLEIK